MNGDHARLNQYIKRNNLRKPISEVIGWSLFFDLPEAAIEARGQKWTKTFVKGNNIVEIFVQTEFQKHWAKDKEMAAIFH